MTRLMAPLTLVLCLGCFRAPEIVVVDRATALEEQAGGSFDELEKNLARAGIAPRPVPFTPEELEALGIRPAELVNFTEMTPADRVDRFLQQRCIGEGREGLLVATPSACKGAVDEEQVQRMIEQINRARAQLWLWLHEQRPAVKPEEVKRAWLLAHARGVVCGGWVQRGDGGWEAKKC